MENQEVITVRVSRNFSKESWMELFNTFFRRTNMDIKVDAYHGEKLVGSYIHGGDARTVSLTLSRIIMREDVDRIIVKIANFQTKVFLFEKV